jgi:Domain of unknown function (DUF4189)
MIVRVLAVTLVLLALLIVALDAFAARRGNRQLWGAIAYNSKTGAYGFTVDQKTKRDAESGAFAQCGSNCDLIKTFRDACGVVATGGKKVTWETGASREIAETKALNKCGDGCAVKVWACTSEK